MLNNFGKAIASGAKNIVNAPFKGLGVLRTIYRNMGILPILRRLPDFGTVQQVTCRARVPVIHKNQECRYVSSKCHRFGLEIQGKFVVYKGKRYPITPLSGSNGEQVLDVNGNKLFAINTAGTNNYSDFEGKVEENKVLVVAYDGNKCVDPVPGRGSRKVVADFQTTVYPFSFSIVNHETKKTDFVLSLIVLPFNACGLVVGCAGRLVASVLSAVAKCCSIPAKYLADKIDRDIIHTSSGVLQNKWRPVGAIGAVFVCILSVLGNVLSTVSCIVRNSADFSEAIIRSPSAIINGIHNENMQCLPVRAGLTAIVDPVKRCVSDLKTSGVNLVKTCAETKARLCMDGEYLRHHMEGKSGFIQEKISGKDLPQQETRGSKQRISRADLEQVAEIGKSLASEIAYGTPQDVNAALRKQEAKGSSKGF
ncbi:hypothetical protein EDL79_01045 [Ehrlichia ruminantium]|uniref:Uncharacterized protein n=1 Tax=Ehrlichia ruminantium TaxID=779 RepID=A0AAE6UKJ1_EHRRU|nr:hypothetical protein [Ehrlichia ruminantium]QGR02273.1 hypothetical protein EDL81_01045 [Ehrlichia ruminantium]QGR03193.1 hypothetical protein EDL80_01045 [Ehrlichia ruminantium]QGR04118.1 hypothetical protein EDL79_01045 [Ehrlichia ruminantium]